MKMSQSCFQGKREEAQYYEFGFGLDLGSRGMNYLNY